VPKCLGAEVSWCRTVRTLRHQCRSVFWTLRHWSRSVLVPKCLGSEVSGYRVATPGKWRRQRRHIMAYRPPGVPSSVPSCRRFLDQPDCIRNIHAVNGRGYTVPGTHWSTLRHCSQLVPEIYMCPWFSKLLIVSAETAWFDKLFRIGITRGTHVGWSWSSLHLYKAMSTIHITYAHSTLTPLHVCMICSFNSVLSIFIFFIRLCSDHQYNHKHRDKCWRLHVRKGVWRIALVWYRTEFDN